MQSVLCHVRKLMQWRLVNQNNSTPVTLSNSRVVKRARLSPVTLAYMKAESTPKYRQISIKNSMSASR